MSGTFIKEATSKEYETVSNLADRNPSEFLTKNFFSFRFDIKSLKETEDFAIGIAYSPSNPSNLTPLIFDKSETSFTHPSKINRERINEILLIVFIWFYILNTKVNEKFKKLIKSCKLTWIFKYLYTLFH